MTEVIVTKELILNDIKTSKAKLDTLWADLRVAFELYKSDKVEDLQSQIRRELTLIKEKKLKLAELILNDLA